MLSPRHPFSGRPLRRAAVAFALLALGACSDSGTGTTTPPDGAVTLTLHGFTFGTSFDHVGGQRQATCQVQIGAHAVGDPGRQLTWGDASYSVFIGPDRTHPAHTYVIPAADVAESWSGASLNAGATQQTVWRVSAGLPFEGEFIFHYASGGQTFTSEPVRVSCGPQPIAGAAAPTLGTAGLSPAGPLEIGGGIPLHVAGDGVGAAGLWAYRMRVEYPGGVVVDSVVDVQPGVTAAAAALDLEVPRTATPGQMISAQVWLMDVAGRIAAGPVIAGPRVDDTRAPQTYYAGIEGMSGLNGQTVAGNTLRLNFGVEEAGVITHVIYRFEALGRTDSVPVPYPSWQQGSVLIATDPAWSFASRLTVWTRDAAGHHSAPVASDGPGVRLFPRVTRPLRGATITRPAHDVAFSPDGSVLYLAQPDGVVRVPLETLTAESVVSGTGEVRGLDVAQDGRGLWLVRTSDPTALYRYDLSTPGTAPRVLASGAVSAVAVRVLAGGRALVHDAGTGETQRVLSVDTTTGASTVKGEWPGWTGPAPTTRRSRDGTRVLFFGGCARMFDSGTGAFSACPEGWPGSSYPGMDSHGDRFNHGLSVFGWNGATVATLPGAVGTEGGGTLSPDGQYLYAPSDRGIDRVRVSDGAYLERIDVPNLLGSSQSPRFFFPTDHRLVVVLNGWDGALATQIYVVELP